MPKKPPRNRPPGPSSTIFSIHASISDTEPVVKLVSGLAGLYEKMAAGEMTFDQATDALGLILTTFQGETL